MTHTRTTPSVADDRAHLHVPYIRWTIGALRGVLGPGSQVRATLISPTPLRSAAVQLGGRNRDGSRDWLCWNELSGWYLGADLDGESGLTRFHWAHLGLLPEPARLALWVRDHLPTPGTGGPVGPPYRVGSDHHEFDSALAEWARQHPARR